MKRSEDRILTTHVGSLVRPDDLVEAGGTFREPANRDPKRFKELLVGAVADVVKKQAEVGIDIVSDGEFGKSSWANYILARITGFEVRPDDTRQVRWLGRDLVRFHDAIAQDMPYIVEGVPVEACVGPIKYVDHESIQDVISTFKAALKNVKVEEAFLTAVAPASTAFEAINEYYDNEHDFVFAIADALREEYLAIHKSGLLVQVDDAVLANMYDNLIQQSPERYHEWADLRVAGDQPRA